MGLCKKQGVPGGMRNMVPFCISTYLKRSQALKFLCVGGGSIRHMVQKLYYVQTCPLCWPGRTRQFDFSHIYYWSNLVVITKRRAKTSDPSSILRPFSSVVWWAIAMSVLVVSGQSDATFESAHFISFPLMTAKVILLYVV